MESYPKTPFLLLLLGAVFMISAQCSKVQVNSNVATDGASATGRQGRAAGEVPPFKPTEGGLEASVFAHPPPEVWLVFPASRSHDQPQAASSDRGATVKVELPEDARKVLRAHWEVALAAHYNLELADKRNAETHMRQTAALINSSLGVARELRQMFVDVPDGRRTLTEDEVRGLAELVGALAKSVVEQAKEYRE